jgi:NAD-dependent deacetylase
MRLRLDGSTRLMVLTGAGVSAESGVPTFRDAGGLWESHPVEKVASPEGFREDPVLVWRFYSERRKKARDVQPNPGHDALAAIEERLGDRFLLVTQNVDGLHRKAGSRRVVEIHGSLFETRCFRCDRPAFPDEAEHTADPPRCELCAKAGRVGLLRPSVVWFGEYLDPERIRQIESFMAAARRERFVFLAVGTSGAVYPAAGYAFQARAAGAETWLVNAEPPENVAVFQHFVRGPSGTVLPGLFEWV